MAALLDAGEESVLAFESAAFVYRWPGFALAPIYVSRPPRFASRPTALSEAHHPLYLPKHHLLVVNGVRVTSPTRTLFDLANSGRVHPKKVRARSIPRGQRV